VLGLDVGDLRWDLGLAGGRGNYVGVGVGGGRADEAARLEMGSTVMQYVPCKWILALMQAFTQHSLLTRGL
jgi:hypothetical protein